MLLPVSSEDQLSYKRPARPISFLHIFFLRQDSKISLQQNQGSFAFRFSGFSCILYANLYFLLNGFLAAKKKKKKKVKNPLASIPCCHYFYMLKSLHQKTTLHTRKSNSTFQFTEMHKESIPHMTQSTKKTAMQMPDQVKDLSCWLEYIQNPFSRGCRVKNYIM